MSELDDEGAGIKPTPEGASLMEQLRKRHEEIASNTTIDFPLPGYEDLLVVRYRVLDVRNDINRISQRVAKEKSKSQLTATLNAALDTIAAACVEIFAMKGDELHPLNEAMNVEVPVRYDQHLVEFMGLGEVSSTRETILAVFGANEPMVMDHAQMLSRWMSNTTKGVNESFVGEL